MKAVVFLALIGLASCRVTLLRDVDRDVKIKYSFDDDFNREVEVDYEDRPWPFLREVLAPLVRHPDPVQFIQAEVAPGPQFRTSIAGVELPRPAVTQVIAEAASASPVFTWQQIVPAVAQPPVFTRQQIVPAVAQPPVFTRQQIVPAVAQPPVFIGKQIVPVVTQPPVFVTKSRVDSEEE